MAKKIIPLIIDVNFLTATQFDTTAEKKAWAENFSKFVANGCKPEKFTSVLYKRLMYLFRHIAHSDRLGFIDNWFSTSENRNDWLTHVLNNDPVGDPAYTWSDIERILKEWMNQHEDLIRQKL